MVIHALTSSNGARASIIDAFGGNEDSIITDALCMVLVYKSIPKEQFLTIYKKLVNTQPEEKTSPHASRSKSRTITSIVMPAQAAREYLDCKTDVGLARSNNEDYAATIVSPNNPNVKLLIVCDGVGGYAHGEEASEMTAEYLIEWFNGFNFVDGSVSYLAGQLEAQIQYINSLIRTKIKGAGTTLTCAIVGERETIIANVGDSRLYSIKDKEIKLLTSDDSFGWIQFCESGMLEPDDLRFYGGNSFITKGVGLEKNCIPTVRVIPNDYDGLLLTTDGVTDILSSSKIERIIKNKPYTKVLDEILKEATRMPYTPEKGIFAQSAFELVKAYCREAFIPVPGKDNATAAMYLKLKR